MNIHAPDPRKFADPLVTAKGEERAVVPLIGARTLWFNTGTLCNIECVNCYIASSPTNDALVYLTAAEVAAYLDQIAERDWPVTEIGFTGGEPFMNPDIIPMLDNAMRRGFEALVLTNAMKPMMRPRVREGLLDLKARHGDRMVLRVSLDHYTPARNDDIRGAGSFADAMTGLRWLRDHRFRIAIAGRTLWHEDEAAARAGYGALFAAEGLAVDANDPGQTVLFPEMDETVDVPEITTACWGILNKRPDSVMCATSRMVVHRKGEAHARVVACTLLPDAADFDLGETLAEAERPVRLNHRHCAKFCVLGGASCSA
jgi:uncharacterized Fe-S cluster-containing radical SAM superfamily protein